MVARGLICEYNKKTGCKEILLTDGRFCKRKNQR